MFNPNLTLSFQQGIVYEYIIMSIICLLKKLITYFIHKSKCQHIS